MRRKLRLRCEGGTGPEKKRKLCKYECDDKQKSDECDGWQFKVCKGVFSIWSDNIQIRSCLMNLEDIQYTQPVTSKKFFTQFGEEVIENINETQKKTHSTSTPTPIKKINTVK